MRSLFFCLALLTVGLIACQTERPPTAVPFAVVLTATSSPTATATHTVSPTAVLTNTPRPTRTPTNIPTVTPTFTPSPTPLPTATPAPTLPASSRSLDLTLVAQTGGEATGLALSEDGRLAYITVGPRLQVYDVADRANPTLQWQSDVFRWSFVGLMVEAEFAFGRLADGWAIWRISSAVPELLWVSDPDTLPPLHPRGSLRTLKAEGKVYLAISEDEWLVFDPSAPTFPLSTVTQAGEIEEVAGGLVIKQSTAEQTIFLFAEGKTLPANVVGKLEIDGRRDVVTIYETYLYLNATGENIENGLIINFSDMVHPVIEPNQHFLRHSAIQQNGQLMIIYGNRALYDLSENPTVPLLLAPIDDDYMTGYTPIIWQNDEALLISMWGDAGYVSTALAYLDLRNLSAPIQQRNYYLPSLSLTGFAIFEESLFILQSTQLTILDITNWEAVTEIGRVEMTGGIWMAVLADEVIISRGHNYNDFARAIPRQFSDAPVTIERIPIDTSFSLEVHQNTLFTAWDGGVIHYHLPTQQLYQWSREILSITDGYPRFASYGEYVVAVDDQKLSVIDLAEPAQPVIIGRYDSPRVQGSTNSLKQMRLINSTAFIASWYELTAVDLSDPSQPQEIAHWTIDEFISSLFSIGETLYIVLRDGNTLVFDVSIPTEPRLVQTIGAQLSGHLYGDFLIGNHYIYDVADPLNPLLVGETGVSGRIIGIRDNLLYVGSSAGVFVYEIETRP